MSNNGDMINFVCTPQCSRISLTVAMETMHFFIVQLSFSLRTKILCISWVPGNDLAPMKKMPLGCIKLAPGVFKLWAFIEENVCPTYARTNV